MEKKPKCAFGNFVDHLCAQDTCPHPSQICSFPQCPCHQKHGQCMGKYQVSILINKLIQKKNSNSQTKDPVLQFYANTIKLLTNQHEEYLQSLSNGTLQLSEDENRLLRLLRQQNFQIITPRLVVKVANSLKQQPVTGINEQLKRQINNIKRQVQKIFSSFAQLWKNKKAPQITNPYRVSNQLPPQQPQYQYQPQPQQQQQPQLQQQPYYQHQNQQQFDPLNFMFNAKFCASGLISNYFQIEKSGKRIKRVKESNGQKYFALMLPSLGATVTLKRVEFRMISISSSFPIFFGACIGAVVGNNSFRLKKDFDGGAYLLGSNGITYSHHIWEQSGTQTNFRCQSGDIVMMEYDPFSYSLNFYKNNDYKNKIILVFQKEARNSLHACILTWDENSKIQIA